jgi:hypothetical protein
MIQLLGVGHPLIDRALAECSGRQVYIARVKGLERFPAGLNRSVFLTR